MDITQISPMLLETAQAPFSSVDDIFEPKIDGHRLELWRIKGGSTRLYTRHGNECTRQYPELHDINGDDIGLDGEVACVDRETGTIDFESIMERFSTRRIDKIQRLRMSIPVNYIVFDILRYRGVDVRSWPLMKRKELLSQIEFGNPHISTIPFIEREGERLFDEIVTRRLEGIVAKRKESAYMSGQRSSSWLKIINWTYVDVTLIGWRKDKFGWLAGGADMAGQVRPVGVIEFGVPVEQRKEFYSAMRPYVTGKDRNNVYVRPLVRARVKIRNWTKKGFLRDPVFVQYVS
jgi:DNA ligase-1